jgi:hypothetical protein
MSYPPPGEGQGREPDPTQQQSGPPYGQSASQDPYGQQAGYPGGYAPPSPGQYGGPGQYGQPSQYGQPGQYGQPPYVGGPSYAPGRGTNVMAILSLVLSILGLFTCVTAPVGAILGHVAKRQIATTGEEGRPLATAGIIIGWVLTGLFALGIVGIIIAIVATNSTTGY